MVDALLLPNKGQQRRASAPLPMSATPRCCARTRTEAPRSRRTNHKALTRHARFYLVVDRCQDRTAAAQYFRDVLRQLEEGETTESTLAVGEKRGLETQGAVGASAESKAARTEALGEAPTESSEEGFEMLGGQV